MKRLLCMLLVLLLLLPGMPCAAAAGGNEAEEIPWETGISASSDAPRLSSLVFGTTSGGVVKPRLLLPAFDPDLRDYTLVAPSSLLTVGSVWAVPAADASGEITVEYANPSDGSARTVTVNPDGQTGAALASSLAMDTLRGNTLTVKIGGAEAYAVSVVRQPVLRSSNGLKLTVDGAAAAISPAYAADVFEYELVISRGTAISVTAAIAAALNREGKTVITVNGEQIASGGSASVTPDFTAGSTWDLCVELTGEGAYPAAYVVHCREAVVGLRIDREPDKTVYEVGELFDPAGMEVTALFADGSEQPVPLEELAFSPDEPLTLGSSTVTVTWHGQSAEVTITVKNKFTGSGTEEDPYLLSSAEDLLTLREYVADGQSCAGAYFRMTEDITLPEGWTPVGEPGDPGLPFSGTIDGGGHLLTVPEGGLPLLGLTAGAAVKNLNIYGSRIEGYGLVNNYEGVGRSGLCVRIDGVTLKSGTRTLRSGLIGTYITDNEYSGSSADFTVEITNCTAEAGVVVGYDGTQSHIGSFAGRFSGVISNCVSSAAVKGVDAVGGIAGSRDNSMSVCQVSNCQFHGTVEASGSYAGGIMGSGYIHESAPNGKLVTITGCSADGSVRGGRNVGGILGGEGVEQAWDNSIGYISANTFAGSVSGTNNIGGIIGHMQNLNRYTIIENNFYEADCGADKGIGGVTHIDTSAVPYGMHDGVFYYNTAVDDLDAIKLVVDGPDDPYRSVDKRNHNRDDDPLGKDADKLCRSGAPAAPFVQELTVSGSFRTEYTVGDALDLTGIVFTARWSDGSVTSPAPEEVSVTGFDSTEPGDKTLSFQYKGTSTTAKYTVKPKSDKIKVTFSLLGHYVHDSDSDGSAHGLSMGGLSTWIAPTVCEADASETVWDVMQRLLADNGVTAHTTMSRGTVYVAGLTYRGVYLAEFTNGGKSGWQYTVNGRHPLLGVAQQYLKDGDVIIFHYTDDYTREEGSEAFNDDDEKAAAEVEKLIDAIGTPVTLNSKAKIEAARAAYNALNYAQKSKVENYAKLTAAEAELKRLQEAEDRKAAEAVEKIIAALHFPVIEEDEPAIQAARKAYDTLTDAQKALVKNVNDLIAAEHALAELNATEEDKKAAADVEKLIDDLSEPVTAEDREAIEAAREAYDALTDLQKALVTNLDRLEEAERELARLFRKGEDAFRTTGDYIESLGDLDVNSEWTVIGMVRSGREVNKAFFYSSVAESVLASINEKEQLHRARSTDNSRTILALTALGYDVTDVAGHNLLMGLTDLDYVKRQGINGPIWALIAMDSGGYELPENPDAADYTTREKIIGYLLDQQLPDGGWALSGNMSDSDITGMCLQALAPYCGKREDVTAAVDKALETLSMMQNSDGSFSAFGGDGGLVPTSESISQILVALSALGIDADKDPRFVKNGNSVLDALLTYYVEGGGFRHIRDYDLDGMATEQAYYALTAYFRMLEGKTALYDMTDAVPTAAPEATPTPEPTPAPEEPAEDVALAVSAAEGGTEKKRLSALWIIPPTALAGAAAYLLDKKRRSGRH